MNHQTGERGVVGVTEQGGGGEAGKYESATKHLYLDKDQNGLQWLSQMNHALRS